MNIWQDFKTNDGKSIHKWSQYFPVYERYLTQWRNRTMTFVEIGVAKGGSLQMWSRFLGPMATVIGLDVNPKCKEHDAEGIHVRIGNQGDPKFLNSVLDEFGAPDVVLDDGSHQMAHVSSTFQHLYPKLSKNGVYIVEDLHTAYWEEYGGGLLKPDTFMNIAKSLVDQLNASYTRGAAKPDFISNNTFGISFYDSMVVFERGNFAIKKSCRTGLV